MKIVSVLFLREIKERKSKLYGVMKVFKLVLISKIEVLKFFVCLGVWMFIWLNK